MQRMLHFFRIFCRSSALECDCKAISSDKVRSASFETLLDHTRQNRTWHVSKGLIVHVTTVGPEAGIMDIPSSGALLIWSVVRRH